MVNHVHVFKIKAGLRARDCLIEMDGKPITGVTRVAFDLSGKSGETTLKLEIIGEVLIDGEFRESDILTVESNLDKRLSRVEHGAPADVRKGHPARNQVDRA